MMISARFSSRILRSLCLLRFNYGNVRSFDSGMVGITTGIKITHSVFLDYVQSTKESEAVDVLQETKKYGYDCLENFKYPEQLQQENWDKVRIKLLLERTDPAVLRKFIDVIDIKCGNIINQLTIDEILEFLILFMKIIPRGFYSMNFYSRSIDILKTALKRHQLKHKDVLKLLFFASVRKKSGVSDVKFIMKYVLPIDQLSLIEKSIVANAVFKSTIRLSKFQGYEIEKAIEENAVLLVSKPYWLVPLCKAVRHVGPSKKFNMNNLSEALINAQSEFDLPSISHIVSLYSEAYVKNTNVLAKLFNDAFKQIVEVRDHVRLKDIDRLLWSGRVLNYPPKSNEIEIINTLIEQRLRRNRVDQYLLMNILLSLWMFGHKCTSMIKQCFDNEIFASVLQDRTLWKSVARLDLLLSCIKIEAPEIQIPDELHIPEKVHLKIRKNIRIIFKSLNGLKNDLRLSDLTLSCPIEGIYISGISAKYNGLTNVHIDLLDESTCLRGSDELHGLMKLKLRLLAKIGYQSILVPETEINNPDSLREYLKKSLWEKL